MNGSRSVRAFVLILTGYATVRTVWVWTPVLTAGTPPPKLAAPAVAGPATPAGAHRNRDAPMALTARPGPIDAVTVETVGATPALFRRVRPSGPPRLSGPAPPPDAAMRVAVVRPLPASAALPGLPGLPQAIVPRPSIAAPTRLPSASRWSGYAYMFHRGDAGSGATLAPAGQIGGSQAAARLAYRLDDAGRIALAARLATPLRATAQADAAIGADLIALPGLRLSVERRIALGSAGRNAFAAYAAGGLYRALAPRIELDGYAQAGVVGTQRRDPFADGAIRLHRRTALAATTDLRLGLAAWGAAQPGAARLDIGPRAAVTTRTARLPVTLAVEARLRVAGHARPGNGIALTLATDF